MTRLSALRRAAGVASLLALVFAQLAVRPAMADDAAALAKQALHECDTGRLATARSDRLTHFQAGEELARRAVATSDLEPEGHFALFCNMGEAMRIDGESLQALMGLGKLMRELDRTLELDPNHLDAMAAKGTLLVRLPRVLGGDTAHGETMLRRVVRDDPSAFTSRLSLARVCADRGQRAEAVQFASRALEIAKEKNRPEKIAEARDVLAKLGVTSH